MNLEAIIDKGINRSNILAGFKRSGIEPVNRLLITSVLPEKCPSYLIQKTSKRKTFSISNSIVTDPDFLSSWKDDIERKEKKGEGNAQFNKENLFFEDDKEEGIF
jgi:hypothetical protein